MTNRGAILGTIRYMSPEQIDAREVDTRSDLFGFGAVLYEMLTGTRAFDGDDASSIRTAILDHEPSRVSSLQPAVPATIDDIVQRCLAKDPDKRWQTAGDVLRELKRASEAMSPAQVRRSTWRWAAGILGAVVTGLLAWLWISETSTERQRRRLMVKFDRWPCCHSRICRATRNRSSSLTA